MPPSEQSGGEPSQTVSTHCPYCALNCGLNLEITADKIEKRSSWKKSPLTRGALCSKGMTAHVQVDHPDRVLQPLVRDGDQFVETSWETALNKAADGFARIAKAHGNDANAVLSGGSLTNEKVYLVGKLARLALKTRHIDYNGRFCMTSAGAANMAAFGADRMMTPLAELERAEVVVVVGANLSAAFPVALPKLIDGVRRRGGRVIVIDPRSSRFIKPDDLHLQIRPATDATLFNALVASVIHHGLIDGEFIRDRTADFSKLEKSLRRFDVEGATRECDISLADLEEAANLIGSTDRCMYLHGRGPEQQIGGVDNVRSIINLGLVCGHVGGEGRGINMLTGQRNGQGGREWGQRCNQLPAGRSIDNPGHRAIVAERWGVHPTELPPSGLTYTEILEAAGTGSIRGLLSICTNMSVSAPDLNAVERQMSALDHVVVIDPFFSRSARHADIVLPGATFAEEDGTITTLEGRVVRIDRAVTPRSGRDEIHTLHALAERLGAGEHLDFADPEEVFEEMRQVSEGGPVDYSGITYERLRQGDGIFWPCPSTVHPGTPQLYTKRFSHSDGRARFAPVNPPAPPDPVSPDRPWVLTTGRVLAQYLSGNQTMRIEAQNRVAGEPVLEIHPDTAERVRLAEEDHVRITSRVGQSQMAWTPNPGLRPDTLFLPYHWPECNRLVAAHLDPTSKIPGFKYTAVSITPVPPKPQASVEIDLDAAGASRTANSAAVHTDVITRT